MLRKLLRKSAKVAAMLTQHYHVDSRTLLHVAIEENAIGAIGLLLDHGADPLATDKWGRSALHYAILAGSLVAVALLCGTPGQRFIHRVAELRRARDFEGSTALHLLAKSSLIDHSEPLLAHLIRDLPGIDENAEQLMFIPDAIGSIPLHLAAEFGSVEICQALIGACRRIPVRVMVDVKNDVGNTPLHRAARRG